MHPSSVDGIAIIWHLSPSCRCLGFHRDQDSPARPSNQWYGCLGPGSVLDIGRTTEGRSPSFSGQVSRSDQYPVYSGLCLDGRNPVPLHMPAFESCGSSNGEAAPFDGRSLACVKLLDGLQAAVPLGFPQDCPRRVAIFRDGPQGSAPATARTARP